ncbi:Cadherin-7 [Manis pentadactyla]|nr:Cadherin-7 [Manis pentadactyla]
MPREDADPPRMVENELEKKLESQWDMGIIILAEASSQKKLGREVKVFGDSLDERNEGEDGRDSSDFWQKKLSFTEMSNSKSIFVALKFNNIFFVQISPAHCGQQLPLPFSATSTSHIKALDMAQPPLWKSPKPPLFNLSDPTTVF